jgi:cardiolipin synthase
LAPYLPNIITLGRLCCVPVVLYLMLLQDFGAAFWVFLAAGVSDALDGLLARVLNARSTFGAYADPLADKALLMVVAISLASLQLLPLWLVFMLVFRDILIVGGAALFHALTHSLKMRPLWISKVNTAAQLTLLAAVMAQAAGYLVLGRAEGALIVVAAATTFLSGAAYVVVWFGKAVALEDDE